MAANSLLAKFLPGGRLVHKMDSRKREDLPQQDSNNTSSTSPTMPKMSPTVNNSSASPKPTTIAPNPYATPQASFQDLSSTSAPISDSVGQIHYPYPKFSQTSYPDVGLPSTYSPSVPTPQYPSSLLAEIAPLPVVDTHTSVAQSKAGKARPRLKAAVVDSDEDGIKYAAPRRRSGLRTPKKNTSLKALENVNGLLDRKKVVHEGGVLC